MSEIVPVAVFLAVDQLYVAGPFENVKQAEKHLYSKCSADELENFYKFSFEGQKMLVHIDDIQVIADSQFYLLDNPEESLGFD